MPCELHQAELLPLVLHLVDGGGVELPASAARWRAAGVELLSLALRLVELRGDRGRAAAAAVAGPVVVELPGLASACRRRAAPGRTAAAGAAPGRRCRPG
jgi:hypothetical protein